MNVQNRAESPIMADAISHHALSCILAKFREKFIKMLRARNAMRSVSGRVDPIDAHTSRDAFAHVGVAPSNSQRFPVGSADLVREQAKKKRMRNPSRKTSPSSEVGSHKWNSRV